MQGRNGPRMTYRPSFTLSARIGPSLRISTFCLSGSCPVSAADAMRPKTKMQAAARVGRMPPAVYFLEPALRRTVFFFAALRAGFLAAFFFLFLAAGRFFFAALALAFFAGAFFAGAA